MKISMDFQHVDLTFIWSMLSTYDDSESLCSRSYNFSPPMPVVVDKSVNR